MSSRKTYDGLAQEIADEVNPLRLKMYNEDMATIKKTKKASGGLAYALGE